MERKGSAPVGLPSFKSPVFAENYNDSAFKTRNSSFARRNSHTSRSPLRWAAHIASYTAALACYTWIVIVLLDAFDGSRNWHPGSHGMHSKESHKHRLHNPNNGSYSATETAEQLSSQFVASAIYQKRFCEGLSSLSNAPPYLDINSKPYPMSQNTVLKMSPDLGGDNLRLKLLDDLCLDRSNPLSPFYNLYVYKDKDIVSATLAEHGEWEADVVRAIVAKLEQTAEELEMNRKSIYFLDLGSHIGSYSIPVAAHGFSVISVEPMHSNAEAMISVVFFHATRSPAVMAISGGSSKQQKNFNNRRDNFTTATLHSVLTIISFFSGIGGEIRAAKILGDSVKVIGACEINTNLHPLLRKELGPDVPIYTDIKDLKQYLNSLKADLWIIGLPCLGTSPLGEGEGMNNEQTGLVLEIFQLLRLIPRKERPSLLFEQPKECRNRLSGEDYSFLEELYYNLRLLKYNVSHSLEQLLQCGVPQSRNRVLLCATMDLSCAFILGLERDDACDGSCLTNPETSACSVHQYEIGPLESKISVFNSQHGISTVWGRQYLGTITCRSSWHFVVPSVSSESLYPVWSFTIEALEMLQGFPLGYTDGYGLDDTARLRAIGNSIAPPVLVPILRRFVEAKSQRVNYTAHQFKSHIKTDGDWAVSFGLFEKLMKTQIPQVPVYKGTSPINGYCVTINGHTLMRGYGHMLGSHGDSNQKTESVLEYLFNNLPDSEGDKKQRFLTLLKPTRPQTLTKHQRRLFSHDKTLPVCVSSVLSRCIHIKEEVLRPNVEVVELCVASFASGGRLVKGVVEIEAITTSENSGFPQNITAPVTGTSSSTSSDLVAAFVLPRVFDAQPIILNRRDCHPCTLESVEELYSEGDSALEENLSAAFSIIQLSSEIATLTRDTTSATNVYLCYSRAQQRLADLRRSPGGLPQCGQCTGLNDKTKRKRGLRPTICLKLKNELLRGVENGAMVAMKGVDAIGLQVEFIVDDKSWSVARMMRGIIVSFDHQNSHHTVLFKTGRGCSDYSFKGRLAESFSLVVVGREELSEDKLLYYKNIASTSCRLVLDARRRVEFSKKQKELVYKLLELTALRVVYGNTSGDNSAIKRQRLEEFVALVENNGGFFYSFGYWYMGNLMVFRDFIDTVRIQDRMSTAAVVDFIKSAETKYKKNKNKLDVSSNRRIGDGKLEYDEFIRSDGDYLRTLEARYKPKIPIYTKFFSPRKSKKHVFSDTIRYSVSLPVIWQR